MFNKKITITVEDVKMSAELNDSNNAQKIWKTLPKYKNILQILKLLN
jgi:hypothetical protein